VSIQTDRGQRGQEKGDGEPAALGRRAFPSAKRLLPRRLRFRQRTKARNGRRGALRKKIVATTFEQIPTPPGAADDPRRDKAQGRRGRRNSRRSSQGWKGLHGQSQASGTKHPLINAQKDTPRYPRCVRKLPDRGQKDGRLNTGRGREQL